MWLFKKMCTSKMRLDGKTAVITGANSGIGKETARDFYGRGARVILLCRNLEKANEAVEDIKKNPPSRITKGEYENNSGELVIYSLDLSNLKSVRDCAKNLLMKEAMIHILVNNAGVAMVPYEKTKDGIEMTFQTNYLSHFLLTLLLLPKMQLCSPGCKIINVSSFTYMFGDIHFDDINLEKSYTPSEGYFQSKLANILFAKELARRLKKANIYGINVYSLHPGLIPTEISRHSSHTMFPGATFLYKLLTWLLFKTLEEGAQTTIYCAVDEKAANESGLYYSDCSVNNPRWRARDDQYSKNLWDISCKLLHLEPEEDFAKFLQTVSCQIT